jgi:uncharacterized protein (DUF362 family)
LEAISEQVHLYGFHRVLVKPNFVSTSRQAASTHVEAVRAVVAFVRSRYDGPIIVGEGAALSSTWEGFDHFGYRALVDEYNVELADLNVDDVTPTQILDRRLRSVSVHLARTTVEPGTYRISVGLPKTHDLVVVTLSIKNMVMGSLVNPRASQPSGGVPGLARRLSGLLPQSVTHSAFAEWVKGALLGGVNGSSKMAMHQGLAVLNLNLALVAPRVWPHLAVLDGWQGMEGRGPGAGDPVAWGVALASVDPLAVDTLATHLMGFDPRRVGYLCYCRQMGLGRGTLDEISVLGDVALESVQRSFEPHPAYQSQLKWHMDGVERYLMGA